MWTSAFLVQCRSAIAATERCAGITDVSPESKDDVGRQQKVADVIERQNAEHDVQNGADGSESEQVEEGIGGLQATDGVVDSCDPDNDDGPHGGNE